MLPLFGFLTLTILGIFWGGYVASVLWSWFMVPLGLVAINYWHATGLSALISVFLGSRGFHSTRGESDVLCLLHSILYSVAIPALALAIGWLSHLNI